MAWTKEACMIPTRIFFTKGVGFHRDQLISFEAALRDAKIANYNLVMVSSILPPKCQIIKQEDGVALLSPGEIVHVVLARNAVKEARRLISAAIGVAVPRDNHVHGYLSELHAEGLNERESRDWAEDLKATETTMRSRGITVGGRHSPSGSERLCSSALPLPCRPCWIICRPNTWVIGGRKRRLPRPK